VAAQNSADKTHGRLGSRLGRWLGDRCRTRIVVSVSVNLSLENWLLQLQLLAHQTNAEDVRRDFAKTNADLRPSEHSITCT